jgi:xylulokinase
MRHLHCGIDIGSTNLKVVLIGDEGRVLNTQTIASPRGHDGIGLTTDPLQLVATLEDLIIKGWRELDAGMPLSSVCAAGIGEDGFGVTADMKPTGPAIAWFDRRAEAEAQRLLERDSEVSARAGITMGATLTGAKWLWLRRNRPDELAQAKHWITLTDFPAVWWTGKPFLSTSLAPRTGCFDVYQRTWIDELLTSAQAPALPPILNAGEVVGGVQSGALRDSGAASAETIVVAGGHDHPIAATAIRRFDQRARVDSLGTANLIYGETSSKAKNRSPHLAFSLPPSGNEGLACLGVIEPALILDSAELEPSHLRQYLSQNRLPGLPPSSKADADGKDIVTRRALERVSMMARQLLGELDDAGVPKGKVYTTGGWSRSRAFVELRASIFGQEISALGDIELTAAGAALFGAEAATGISLCPFDQTDIVKVEPVQEWMTAYADLYQ